MRKLALVIAALIVLVSLSGCSGEYHDTTDIAGTWYSTSDDESTVVFYDNGAVIMEEYHAGVGIYTYNSGEMDGVIFMSGWIPRIYSFYYYLDDTMSIGGKEYCREN